jgi:hypothetical protein
VRPLLWLAYILLQIPLWLAGVPICFVLARREAWVLRPSKYFAGRTVTAWRCGWAQAIFGNWEDGVVGPAWWKAQHPDRPDWWLAFVWSAWRNPTNNTRFIPLLNPVIDPARIRYHGNVEDPARNGLDRLRIEWSYTWQGIYAGVVFRWQITATHHASVRLGWKLLPRDRHGVAPTDYRSIRCPFGVQLHLWRATHA